MWPFLKKHFNPANWGSQQDLPKLPHTRWVVWISCNDELRYGLYHNAILVSVGYFIPSFSSGKKLRDGWNIRLVHTKSGKSILLNHNHFLLGQMNYSELLLYAVQKIDSSYRVSTEGEPFVIDYQAGQQIATTSVSMASEFLTGHISLQEYESKAKNNLMDIIDGMFE